MSLRADVDDVIDAMNALGAMFLLTGRARTKTGNKLANAAYTRLVWLYDERTKLIQLTGSLAAEVDGLRSQNEQLTALLDANGKDGG